MPSETDKILALVNGSLTLQGRKTDKLIDAIGELVQVIKAQKMTVEAPVVNITSPEVNVPEIKIPPIELPKIEVPKAEVVVTIPPITVPTPQVTVNVPEQPAPIVNVPAPIVNVPEFPKEMEVGGIRQFFLEVLEAIRGILPYSIWNDVSRQSPIPVILIDPDGAAYKARGGSTSFSAAGGVTEPAGNPIGYQQLTVSTAAVTLTIPAGASRALITVESDTVRWRDDGQAPTSTVGLPMVQGQTFELSSSGSLSNFQAIQDANATTSPILNISYYKR